MVNKPLISIITPVYNGIFYIKECINSILLQSEENWELLISDDGSTDGTLLYLDTLTDPRIKVFKQNNNLGIFGNLNFLFSKARAPISQILCQDDHFFNEKSLSTIISYWKTAHPEVGFVRFNLMEEPSNYSMVNLQKEITPPVISSDQADLWFFLFGNIPGNLSNVSLKTNLVTKVGLFKQELPFAGDFEFWSRAARSVSMGISKQMVVHVRRHERVASNYLNQNGELYTQHLVIYEKLLNILSKNYDRKVLVSYFNYEVGSFHYRTGIRSALAGQFTYLNIFARSKSKISWPTIRRLIACFPFALFEKGRQRYILKKAIEILTKYPNKTIRAKTIISPDISTNIAYNLLLTLICLP
jgi:glycosyltransferase involved in cell wall biosynthesis